MKNIFFSLTFSVILTSCGPLSVNRSFIDEMDSEGPEYFVAGKSFDYVPGDTGRVGQSDEELERRTPKYDMDAKSFEERSMLKQELAKKMASLSEPQKKWFRQNEGLFSSDSQKLYFLNLTDAEREDYLYSVGRKITKKRTPASYFRYSPRQNKEVIVGMHKKNVIQQWGNPHRIDVAGNPDLENERWTFYENGQRRFVYFSSGRVEGWAFE